MPINILPKDEPDWIEFSLKNDILFTDIDPFWKTKTGNDPNNATLYRGGLGFFDVSTDGGKTWANNLPGTSPPWFVGGENMWDSSFNKFEPMPRPATGEPSYDNEIPGPLASQLRYQSYSGSPTRSGEHVVLCAYTVANAAGYLDQGDFNNELELAFMLYTFDDWNTHGWHQVLLSVDRGEAVSTQSAALVVRDEASQIDGGTAKVIRVGAGKFAVFWSTGGYPFGTAHCKIIQEVAGVFTVLGSGSSDPLVENHNFTPDDNIWEHNGHVIFSDLRKEEEPVGTKRAKMHITDWNCTGSTPIIDENESSDFLPDYAPDNDFTNMAGGSFFMTPTGKVVFWYWASQDVFPEQGNDQKHFLFYYDRVSVIFSEPELLEDGVLEPKGDLNAAPYTRQYSAQSVGGDKIIICLITRWYWSLRSTSEWLGELYFTTVGTWTRTGALTWLDVQESSNHSIGVYNTKIWDADRFCFYPTTHTVLEAEMYRIGIGDTLTYLPNAETFDKGDRGGTCIPEDNFSEIGLVAGEMQWSRNNFFPDNSVTISNAPGSLRAGFGDQLRYARVPGSGWDGDSYVLNAYVTTIPPKPPDDMMSRYLLPSSVAYDADGDYIWLMGHEYEYGKTTMRTTGDRMTRNPSHLPAGSVGYDDDFATGWQWIGWDNSGYTKAELDAGDTYAAVRSWPGETEGIMHYGKLYGLKFPTEPAQCWAWRSAGWFEIWSVPSFTDPCRWFISIGGRLYGIAEAATAVKLYEAKVVMIDNGDNMIYVSDLTIGESDVGNIMDFDSRDGSIVVAGGVADLLMVVTAAPPWTTWNNLTLSHRNDRGITGLIVMEDV